MEPTGHKSLHPLAPDLAAIEALAARSRPDAGQAAMAVYEDICWRLALVHFTPEEQDAVTRHELEAARLLRAFLGGQLPPAEFWEGFLAIVTELDDLTSHQAVKEQDERDARLTLRQLHARVSEAALPPTVRRHVQVVLDLMQDSVAAYHAGRLEAAQFWQVFERGETTVEEAIAQAAGEPGETPEERLHHLAALALRADPPAFLRQPIADRLIEQADAWQEAQPISARVLDELESLIERAQSYHAAHGEAERRFRSLREAAARQPLKAPFDEEAQDQLTAMQALLSELEAGHLPEATFAGRFELAAHRLEQLLSLQQAARDTTPEAESLFSEARRRVSTASMPRFVTFTARELLGQLAGLLNEQQRNPRSVEMFWTEFNQVLRELDVTLEFGRDVMNEETEALRRYENLMLRLSGLELSPLLRGPVADVVETLRGLLSRLNAGLYPLADFHHAFEAEAQRLEALLAWQSAMAPAAPAAPLSELRP